MNAFQSITTFSNLTQREIDVNTWMYNSFQQAFEADDMHS
jgi:hypothetical protein